GTSREAMTTRELPPTLIVLGGGPVGLEAAQLFTRFGTRVVLVTGDERLLADDHPETSRALTAALTAEGVELRTGVRAISVVRSPEGRKITLSDGSTLQASQILVATGRRGADLRSVGVEEAGAFLDEEGQPVTGDGLRIADHLFVAGDVAGGPQFTHVAEWEGRRALREALGDRRSTDLS